jgi:hypothetical protein
MGPKGPPEQDLAGPVIPAATADGHTREDET